MVRSISISVNDEVNDSIHILLILNQPVDIKISDNSTSVRYVVLSEIIGLLYISSVPFKI